MKYPVTVIAVIAVIAVAAGTGCGDDTATTSADVTTSTEDTSAAIQEQNDAVVEQAANAPDATAASSESEIRATLEKKLNVQPDDEFNVDGKPIPANQVGGDCYIKTGAEAQNFSYQKKNILYSPDGEGLIFVQSSTTTPLVDCLTAVQAALGW